MSIHLSIHLSIFLKSIYLSIYLSVYSTASPVDMSEVNIFLIVHLLYGLVYMIQKYSYFGGSPFDMHKGHSTLIPLALDICQYSS